jgi:hypothetical protein
MDLRQLVEDSRGGFERLVSAIPGYHGYKEKEDRRAADKLLREHLAKQLNELRRQLADLQRDMLDGGGLLLIDDVDRAVTKVQKLADKIKTASYGYAGLFDAVKVKEGELDSLYMFDEDMLTYIEAIQTTVNALAAAIQENGDVKAAIKDVVSAAEEAEATWSRRESAITGAV